MSNQPKMITCKTCNAPISKNAKTCPSCGAKNKKPFYKRTWFLIFSIIILLFIILSFKKINNEIMDKNAKYSWPNSKLTSLIPQPKSKYGAIIIENEDSFSINIYHIRYNQFEKYIEECKECGFTEDYSRTNESYFAENADGISLDITYSKKEKTMFISMNTPLKEDSKIQDKESENENIKDADNKSTNNEGTKNTDRKNSKDTKTEESSAKEDDLVNGLHPDFKKAMDSYEDFYNDYCDFMKKYEKDPTDLELITQYADMSKKLIDTNEKFEKWEEDDLNNAELKYYLDVQARITKKLAEVTE